MNLPSSTYISRRSPIHTLDARVKVLLLFAYSLSLFFLETWWGMGLAAVALLAVVVISRLPLKPLLAPLAPVYAMVVIAMALNALAFQNGAMQFLWQNLNDGLLMGARILLIAWASLVATYSTTSNQLMDAFTSFLRPLQSLGVPTDDIALTLSLALRFIPLTAEELKTVRRAQYSRGAAFGAGGLRGLKAWMGAFVPVLVGMFRRADRLAIGLETRCYGSPTPRTRLHSTPFTAASGSILIAGLAICIATAIAF